MSVNTASKKKVGRAILALIALNFFALVPAFAQFADPLQKPNDIANQLNQFQQIPDPPPPGSGNNPLPVNPGDTGALMAPPTGQADNTAGTSAPVGVGQSDPMVRIFVDNADKGTGLRMVQTLRPNTLTAEQLGKIQGLLGVNLSSGEPIIDVTTSKDTMEQINQALAPYPDAPAGADGRKQITADNPAQGYPRETPKYDFKGPLPTVRTFSRYLVILGVVAATIFMALAATSVVLGHPYAGSRVVGAAAGLMLLLMGYTIWKIVQMNTFNFNSDDPAQINQKSDQGNVSDAYLQAPNVPQQPALPGGVTRPGIPVAPLRGSN